MTDQHWIDRIPARTKEDLVRYRDEGIRPGDFLYHVLANDLTYAVLYSDQENYKALKEIIWWCSRFLPREAWGSFDRVRTWLHLKGLPLYPKKEQFLARLQSELKALNRSDEL